jgi:hypothetical protein
MRMRVTKPDFWESEDIGDLSHFARLLLKAVWSYVDDNGVQKDSAVGIAAECFRFDLARDPRATIATIGDGLASLWEAGFIIRYEVDGTRYIEAVDFKFWQNPKNPSKPRYPTSSDARAAIDQPLRRLYVDPAETLRRSSLPESESETEPETEPELQPGWAAR